MNYDFTSPGSKQFLPQGDDSNRYELWVETNASEYHGAVRIHFLHIDAYEAIDNTPPLQFPELERDLTEHNTFKNN